MEGLSRSKSGKGLKKIKKKYRHVCLRTPDLPAFAELQNSYPFRSYLALKFGFFYFVRKWGGFDIHFWKSGGAREKTNLFKRFIAYSTTEIQKEFPFRILLVEI
jgi:hypothetical protein